VIYLTDDNQMKLACRKIKTLKEAKSIADGAVANGMSNRAAYVHKGMGSQVYAVRAERAPLQV